MSAVRSGEDVVVRTGLVSAATDVRDTAARHAAESETLRRQTGAAVAAATGAGFARHFVPQRWGGDAGTFRDLLDAVAVVGEGSASDAWCAALYATLGRMAAHLPPAGQEEIWGDGPDALVVGAITPSGLVRSVADGWVLSGEWPFTSAADFSDWALVAGVVPASEPGGGLRYFAVPRHDYTVVDTWFNVGMRGTGSNTLRLDDVFVPRHRTFAGDELWQGRNADSAERCHNVPFKAVNGLSFVAPALGAVRAALDHWTSVVAHKVEITGKATRDKTTVRLALARAAAETDAAALLLERAADAADRAPITPEVLVRNSRDYAVAVDLLVTAVDRVFRAGGARGQRDDDPVQRAWRDVTCCAGHVALQFELNGGAYADHVLRLATT